MSRDRDRILEQALTHELRAAGAPDRDACVDAETLGAWADGGLDRAQMAAVEVHVSTCARCLAIAGATARSARTATRRRGTRHLLSRGDGGWRRSPRRAAAVTLWMVVPRATRQSRSRRRHSRRIARPPTRDAPDDRRQPAARRRDAVAAERVAGERRRRVPIARSGRPRRRKKRACPRRRTRTRRNRCRTRSRSPGMPHPPPLPRLLPPRQNVRKSARSRVCADRDRVTRSHRAAGASSMARSSAARTAARRGAPLDFSLATRSPAARRRRRRSAGSSAGRPGDGHGRWPHVRARAAARAGRSHGRDRHRRASPPSSRRSMAAASAPTTAAAPGARIRPKTARLQETPASPF